MKPKIATPAAALVPNTQIRPVGRVAPRVQIQAIHRVRFLPMTAGLPEEMKLSNVSVSGIGLLAEGVKTPPAKDSVVEGSLTFDDGSFPVRLRVVHSTQGILGARFEGDTRGLREAIRSYFEVELLALGMLKVNPAHHKAEPDGQAHWIHGDQCELYYVADAAGAVMRFKLTFVGNRIEWSPAFGLGVGQVVNNRAGIMRTDDVVEAEATEETIELAHRFLLNIVQLEPAYRQQIGERISEKLAKKP
jgi:hypothetical protein